MERIKLLEPPRQHKLIEKELNAAWGRVFASGQFVKGFELEAFEAEFADFLGVKHVIGCANGTDALQLALMALDLPVGSEVVVPNFSYVSPAEVVRLLGLKPVFADVDSYTFNVYPSALERVVTPNTKAIIAVHLFGQSAYMEPVIEIAHELDIPVIEDNAQSVGAEYTFDKGGLVQKTGTMGLVGATSFFPSKNLGCYGDGGAVTTNDEDLAKRIRQMANHGQSKKYHFDEIGINSRLDALQAAVLRVRLPRLVEENRRRQKIAAIYEKAFNDCDHVTPPYPSKDSTHVYHQYAIKVPAEHRDQLWEFLEKQGVETAVHYPKMISQQPAYASEEVRDETFPASAKLVREVLSIPVHPLLTDSEAEYVAEQVVAYFDQNC